MYICVDFCVVFGFQTAITFESFKSTYEQAYHEENHI